jgi:transposase
MVKARFSDDFKRDAVAQITERGYPVAEVSQRLGVSQHSLYAWKKKFSRPSGGDDKDAEIRRLKRELTRVTEERDILKKATVGSTGQRNGSLQHIGWRLIAKGFPRPGVELESDGVEVVLTVAR